MLLGLHLSLSLPWNRAVDRCPHLAHMGEPRVKGSCSYLFLYFPWGKRCKPMFLYIIETWKEEARMTSNPRRLISENWLVFLFYQIYTIFWEGPRGLTFFLKSSSWQKLLIINSISFLWEEKHLHNLNNQTTLMGGIFPRFMAQPLCILFFFLFAFVLCF